AGTGPAGSRRPRCPGTAAARSPQCLLRATGPPRAPRSRCWGPGGRGARRSAFGRLAGFGGALGVAVGAPGVARERDAAPDLALLRRAHLGPVLHFLEAAPAALALRVALARRADRDARRVRLGLVPGLPRGIGLGREAALVGLFLAVEDHQRIDLGQRAQLGRERDAVRRGPALAPIVDGGFDV